MRDLDGRFGEKVEGHVASGEKGNSGDGQKGINLGKIVGGGGEDFEKEIEPQAMRRASGFSNNQIVLRIIVFTVFFLFRYWKDHFCYEML